MAWQAIVDLGDEVSIDGFFEDTTTGVPRDPDTVTLELRRPDGAKETITTGTGIFKVTNDADWPNGKFRYLVTADVPGEWRYRWQGTGAAQGSSEVFAFNVRADTV